MFVQPPKSLCEWEGWILRRTCNPKPSPGFNQPAMEGVFTENISHRRGDTIQNSLNPVRLRDMDGSGSVYKTEKLGFWMAGLGEWHVCFTSAGHKLLCVFIEELPLFVGLPLSFLPFSLHHSQFDTFPPKVLAPLCPILSGYSLFSQPTGSAAPEVSLLC